MRLLLALAAASLWMAMLVPGASSAQDTDGDTVPDALDNCLLLANPAQCDTNMDGYGNACDADFDNNGVVGASDFNIFRIAYTGAYNPDVDMDCSGPPSNGITDYNLFGLHFLTPPGPSGLACAGTIPCP